MNELRKKTEEIIEDKIPYSLNDLKNPFKVALSKFKEAKEIIMDALMSDMDIYIYGDYDADGVSSTAILKLLLEELKMMLGAKSQIYCFLPDRFKDGYGLKKEAISKFETVGLLITVDNGINSNEAIKEAKDKGFKVLILDHHIANGTIPECDLWIDPIVTGEDKLCGAGIAYTLAEECLGENHKLLTQLVVLAAIGTVADMVSLLSLNNRRIVKKGLLHMLEFGPILKIIEEAEIYNIDEHMIGFKLAPLINACGRLESPIIALNHLIGKEDNTKKMIELNKIRIELTDVGTAYAEKYILDNQLSGNKVFVINAENTIHEGVLGLIAGKITNKYNVSSILLGKKNSELKGSARGYGTNVHLTEVLSKCPSLITYGGHKEAAGLSLKEQDFYKFEDEILSIFNGIEIKTEDAKVVPELKITPTEIEEFECITREYAPYGMDFPKLVVEVENIDISPYMGKFFNYVGEKKEIAKAKTKENITIIAFDKDIANDCVKNQLKRVDVVGNVSSNRFRREKSIQLEATTLQKSKVLNNETSLQALLRKRMSEF